MEYTGEVERQIYIKSDRDEIEGEWEEFSSQEEVQDAFLEVSSLKVSDLKTRKFYEIEGSIYEVVITVEGTIALIKLNLSIDEIVKFWGVRS